ncbi:MAG: diaminopimelate epimerase [Acidimicrobiales bacterium]|nr:diaminopimelate epimerase [Acidimicrobiales bacterium]
MTKHHGLGNDFLVLLDPASDDDVPPELARWACDRRRGVGADGFVVGSVPTGFFPDGPPHLRMLLRNADGGRAEMSGNGIRCLAQAEARRMGVDRVELRILTDAGMRVCEVREGPDPRTAMVSVDMGRARALPDPGEGWQAEAGVPVRRAALVDLGNPHAVLLVDDPSQVDLAVVGPAVERRFPAGINVEVVAPTAGGGLRLRVWERGAGITEACGTGACAAAWAAHGWGLTGVDVTVHMPGGEAAVMVGDHVTLVGPATYVADIDLDPEGARAACR